ncbi:MAG TPA: hypothetical protein VFM46_17815, partial [Pseudomonadales bacterium]|nr:hypothetical protein [Pseudomonadales bacterium]
TRNGVFLPQSVYVDRTRNFTMRGDEAMYFGEWRSEQWTLNWKLAAGKNIPDRKELIDFFHVPENMSTQFESTNVWQFQLMADYDAGRIRFGFSEYDSPTKYTLEMPSMALMVKSEGNSHWRALSFEYNEALWSFTTEIIRGIVNYNGMSPIPSDPDYKDYPEAAYMQLMWHLTQTQTVFVRKEHNYLNRNDPAGRAYALLPLAVAAGVKPEDRYGLSNVLGWSYMPTPSWLIRLDLSKNTGTMLMTARDAPAGYVTKLHWNMAALAVAWRF